MRINGLIPSEANEKYASKINVANALVLDIIVEHVPALSSLPPISTENKNK
jgi:hypothetical protein